MKADVRRSGVLGLSSKGNPDRLLFPIFGEEIGEAGIATSSLLLV